MWVVWTRWRRKVTAVAHKRQLHPPSPTQWTTTMMNECVTPFLQKMCTRKIEATGIKHCWKKVDEEAEVCLLCGKMNYCSWWQTHIQIKPTHSNLRGFAKIYGRGLLKQSRCCARVRMEVGSVESREASSSQKKEEGGGGGKT